MNIGATTKKVLNNRVIVTIAVAVYPVYKFLSKYIHKRDFLMMLLGAVITLTVMRSCVDPKNVKVDVATVEPTVIIEARTDMVMATPVPINEEAENIARVLYGVRDYHLSENAKLAIIETIYARVDCTYGEFGDTINEVCLKPMQWQGFVEGGSYMREDYELALDYINGSHTARVTPEGCYWFVVEYGSVTVRTSFNGGNSWVIK